MAHKRNKYGNKPPEVCNGKGQFIPIDPKTNYAEFEFEKAHWSWFHFLEHIHNIRTKWIHKVIPKFPELLELRKHDKVEIRYKYYSDDFSHLVDTEGMHKEILANYPFRFEFYNEPNLERLLKKAGYLDRTVEEYIEESDKYFDQIAKGEREPYKDKFHQSAWLDKETVKETVKGDWSNVDWHWT